MSAPRYKQLIDRVAQQIRSGRLAPDTQLPTHRQLPAQETLALATAAGVYAALERLGLVAGEAARGAFVRETALPSGSGMNRQASATDLVDLTFSYPTLPGQTELLRTALRPLAAAGDLEAFLRHQPHAGGPHERAVFAQHLARCGAPVGPAQVPVANGAQHGLAIVAMALLQPGDVVAADALTSPGCKALAEQFRLHPVALPACAAGPDLETLERLCRRRPVRAVYAMPTVPTRWTGCRPDRIGSGGWRSPACTICCRSGMPRTPSSTPIHRRRVPRWRRSAACT